MNMAPTPQKKTPAAPTPVEIEETLSPEVIEVYKAKKDVAIVPY